MCSNTFKINIGDGIVLHVERGKYGMEDEEGHSIVPPMYSYISTAFANVFFFEDVDGCQGLLNKKGEEILPAAYDRLGMIKYDMLAIEENDAWGIANIEGEILLPPIYNKVSIRDEETIYIEINGNWGIFNIYGECISPCVHNSKQEANAYFLVA